ncbi:uncharacterized protein LOC134804329 isoform X1 [Cydia splendana]|uniref:uncharacterized protein LOC134804329 isoform X1 n=1 Tax=Cydia splendana TaxID=1100963 RepID=UPI0028F48ACF
MIFAFIIICFYLIVLSQEILQYDVTTANQVVFINSDDDELNQALLLIDMLKTDYLKLLRENSEVAENVTAMVEQSTGAATPATTFLEKEMSGSTLNPTIVTVSTTTTKVPHDEKRDSTTPNKGDAAWQSWHPPMVHAAPMFPLRWADLGTTRSYSYTMPLYDAPNPPRQPRPVRLPLRPWRRFFPDSFFYDVHPRRFPKSPLFRRPDRPSTLATTRANIVQKMVTTERPTTSTKNIKHTSSKTTSKYLRTSNGRTLRQRTSKKATFHNKTSTYIENTDPVEAEVASELLKEFKLINITPKNKIRKTVTVGGTSTE